MLQKFMFSQIRYTCGKSFFQRQNFSSASTKQYDFQDILFMKKIQLQEGIQYYQLHYKSQRFVFPNNLTVLQFESEIQKVIPDVYTISTYKTTPRGEIQFSSTTPLMLVLVDDFIVRFNNQEKYIILTKVDDPPVIDLVSFYQLNQHSIQKYFDQVDQTERQRVVLSDLVARMFTEISKTTQTTLDRNFITLLIKKVILKIGSQSKTQKQIIEQQISFLQQKELKLEHIQSNVKSELERDEQKLLYKIYLYIVAQIAFTQYGTFVVWGWQVMEPITFLIGVSDMILGYIFWMRTTKSYGYDNILTVAVNQHLDKKLEENFYYKDELSDLQRMIEYLKFKQMLYSTSLNEVLSVIEGAIDGEIVKKQENEEDEG